jgi:hypothetical protein
LDKELENQVFICNEGDFAFVSFFESAVDGSPEESGACSKDCLMKISDCCLFTNHKLDHRCRSL